jgi:hypothetical protein
MSRWVLVVVVVVVVVFAFWTSVMTKPYAVIGRVGGVTAGSSA